MSPGANPRLAGLAGLGTSIWLDLLRRSMLTDGELERLIAEDSATGLTSNPSIFEKAILGSPDYDEALAELVDTGRSPQEIYETFAIEDVQGAADQFRPVWDATGGADGFASLEVDPGLARDTDGTIAAAADLWSRVDRPNAMIKIPGTDEGLGAIQASIAAGINVNITLLFSVEAYGRVIEAHMAGLEERRERGEAIDGIRSVASFFVSRVDTMVDGELGDGQELRGTAGVANAQVAFAHFQEVIASERWRALEKAGAVRQRPLWASTGTKDPAYPDVKYVDELAGPGVVNTMPLETLHAYADHGDPEDRLTGSADAGRARMEELAAAGISMKDVTARLLDEGIDKFSEAMASLLRGIERKRDAILSEAPPAIAADLPDDDATAIGARVDAAEEADVLRRIWRKDHTLWAEQDTEITNRLGWLSVSEEVLESLDGLSHAAAHGRNEGITDCAVLGMGGSSLAPEVLRRSLSQEGMTLHVLDSTHPDTVERIRGEIPLEKTLFLVASKSGTTLEPNCFMSYFRDLVPDAARFAAITDPGTALDHLARDERFGHVFCANPEIGGRYSALSHFGMVPATMGGVGARAILEQAGTARHAAMPTLTSARAAPLWLGLAIGELARRGRDKLTFVCDEPLGSFGLWVEQLVAESTGKQGTGIVPVAAEPLGEPGVYGEDRVFVRIRNAADPDKDADERLAALATAGQPVLTMSFDEAEEVGSLFFTWEFAIATAGHVLGINPFDQPNVQEAKDLTNEVIEAYVRDGGFQDDDELGVADASPALADLLGNAGPGGYFAVLAYVPESDEADAALRDLRIAVRDARRCATTTGYGPRYLHSTGQLHKGGTPSGIFLQVTSDPVAEAPIPGKDYGFGALVRAQAIGDLKALQAKERPALRVNVGSDPVAGLRELSETIKEVL